MLNVKCIRAIYILTSIIRFTQLSLHNESIRNEWNWQKIFKAHRVDYTPQSINYLMHQKRKGLSSFRNKLRKKDFFLIFIPSNTKVRYILNINMSSKLEILNLFLFQTFNSKKIIQLYHVIVIIIIIVKEIGNLIETDFCKINSLNK
jgi:hypothetical protein